MLNLAKARRYIENHQSFPEYLSKLHHWDRLSTECVIDLNVKDEEYTTNNQPFASDKDPTKNVLFDQTYQPKPSNICKPKKQI